MQKVALVNSATDTVKKRRDRQSLV